MNITMTGNLGSGKSSVCKVFKEMGFNITSTGDIFRSIAAERGISVIELNEIAKTDRSIDDMIDARSTKLGKELDNTVFDSRMAWHFAVPSFKVFLLVDVKEAARRVFAGASRNMEEYSSEEECAAGLTERAKLERARYLDLYKVDYFDADNFDLVIESSNASPEVIAERIVAEFKAYKPGNKPKYLLSNGKDSFYESSEKPELVR